VRQAVLLPNFCKGKPTVIKPLQPGGFDNDFLQIKPNNLKSVFYIAGRVFVSSALA
jgi:hypothetical protein